MPYVPKFTNEQLQTISKSMQEYPPDEVEKDYRTGQISLKDKLYTLSKYGDAKREIAMRGTMDETNAKNAAVGKSGGGFAGPIMGEGKFYAQNVFNEFKASWDAATATGDPKVSEAVFRALMGSLKVLDGLNIPGDVVERWALEKFPESPGFARAANWGVWLIANYGGLTAMLKAPFKAAGASMRAGVKGAAAVSDYASFVKNPVAYVTKQAVLSDAQMATKLAKTQAENTVRKSAGVAGAAVQAEKAGGNQAFKVADPAVTPAPGAIPAPGFASPQDLEAMTTTELIKHYEERAAGMIRKGISHDETKASSTMFSIDEIAKRGPGDPISATELEGLKLAHEQISKGFNAILDESSQHLVDIAAGNRPDLVQAYKSHLAAMEITNPAFLGGVGEAGRALRYVGELKDLVSESRVFDNMTSALASEKLLESNDKAIAYTMQKLFELGKTERAKMVEAAGKPDFTPGTTRLLYKSFLFARPGIHAANLIGNSASIVLHGANKTVSAYLDPFSDIGMREANAYWSGMFDSRKKFFEMYEKASARSAESLSKAGIEGSATGKMVQYGPLGWLGFEDEFMQGVVGEGLAKARAVTDGLTKWDELQAAAKAGVFQMPATNKKKWLDDYVDAAMADPHSHERLINMTEKEADYIIFHSPLSHGGELAAKLVRETKFDYLAPVVKFPINAMKMARDWTPGLQSLSKDFIGAVAEGGARADAARSRMALSWMISAQVYEAAKAGIITGDGPVNPEARDAWIKAGNTPRSIHGFPIAWMEPIATWFSFIADLAHNASEMKDEDLGTMFQAAMTSGYQAASNNYFLRIAEGVTNAVTDVKQVKDLNDILGAVGKTVLQPAKTIIGGGTPGRVVGEMVNPEMADMKIYDDELASMKNWFFANTIFGKDTRPRLNNSGKIQIIAPMMGAKWLEETLGAPQWLARGITGLLLPTMRPNTFQDDPVAKIMDKHGLTIHDNWKYYGGTGDLESPLPPTSAKPRVSLTGDQAYNWKHLSLNEAREYGTNRSWVEAVEAMDADPRFQDKIPNEKDKEFRKLYATFRRGGLDILRKMDPDVLQKERERDLAEAEQKGRSPGFIQSMFGSSQEAQPAAAPEEAQAPPPVQQINPAPPPEVTP